MNPFSNRFTVVYDACILYPFKLRDFFMWLAIEDIFRARWTDAINDEWTKAVLRDFPDISPERLETTRRHMNENVQDAIVVDYEDFIPLIELPDRDDRHVVAAAIKSHANAIITLNTKHFPQESLAKFNIEAIHPDDFVICQLDMSLHSVLRAAKTQRENYRRPPLTVAQYLEALAIVGLPQASRVLKRYQEFL